MLNIYTISLLSIIILGLLMGGQYPRQKSYIIIASVIMFVILGLRDPTRIGVDTTTTYYRFYTNAVQIPLSDILDKPTENIGFGIFTYLCSSILKLPYHWFIFIIALFVIVVLGRFLYKYSISPMESIVYYYGLLFYTFHFSGLKQSIAMTIVLLAYDYIVSRKPIKFVLTVCIASLFHFPALIFIPAYWIANQKNIKYYVMELIAIFVAVLIFRNQIVGWMTSIYDTGLYNYSSRLLTNKVIIMLLMMGVASLIKIPTDENQPYVQLLRLIGVATIIQTFSVYSNTFERLADYYFQFCIIYLPMGLICEETDPSCLGSQQKQNISVVLRVFLVVFFVWRFITYVEASSNSLLPFRFW